MGVLHSGHNDGTAEACARLICLWSGHCRDYRGALAFDMLPTFAVAAKSFSLLFFFSLKKEFMYYVLIDSDSARTPQHSRD